MHIKRSGDRRSVEIRLLSDAMTTEQILAREAARLCGGSVSWDGIVPIADPHLTRAGWDGVVTLFSSQRGRIFAWAVEGADSEVMMRLAHPPGITPHAAVSAWLASKPKP